MTLSGGQSLLHYRLVEKIGEGGMGVVWKAVDTTLDREVAIKVLPELFAADGERVARFQREARLLASLNHPGIAVVYGLHEAEGLRFLAMELVPGETLARRLAQGPLGVDQALFTGVQVAEALEAAHAQGVVHRDLKPGNIIIAPDGKAKVLDFGLAKGYDADGSGSGSGPTPTLSPTLTTDGTRQGVILGTAAYMSPEQARGRALDKRTDVFSFGCVLYECLTAHGPFKGETVSDSLGAILHKEPDYERLPETTPPMVRLLLRRCLAKDATKRLHDIADARIELEQAIEDPQGSLAGLSRDSLAVAEARTVSKRRRIRKRFAAAGVVLGLAAGLIGGWMLRGAPEPPPLRKLDLGVEVVPDPDAESYMAISPDGSRVAYAMQGRLWVQLLNELEPRALDGVEDPEAPFWSPDGEWIGYFSAGRLWKVQSLGGRPTALCELGDDTAGGVGASWGEDGAIVFSRGNSGLMRVSSGGGEPREIVPPGDGVGDLHEPSVLPGGRGILMVVHPTGSSPGVLAVQQGNERRVLIEQSPGERILSPVYDRSGHILFARRSGQATAGLWALPFSLDRLESTGEPFLVVPDASAGSVSRDGTLAFIHNPLGSGNDQLVRVDREGRLVEPVSNAYDGVGSPSLSPDGRLLAFGAREAQGGGIDIRVRDLRRGTETRLTNDENFKFFYHWVDSAELVFTVAERGGEGASPTGLFIYRVPADGSAAAVKIGPGVGDDLTPDGGRIVTTRAAEGEPQDLRGRDADSDLWLLDLDGGGASPLIQAPADQMEGRISPDGRWLAYVSEGSGREEVYLTRFPEATGRWQVSLDGGSNPRWSRDGGRLYFVSGGRMMEVSFRPGDAPELGRPLQLFELDPDMMGRGYCLSADGESFIVAVSVRGEDDETAGRTGIKIVQSWYREFE